MNLHQTKTNQQVETVLSWMTSRCECSWLWRYRYGITPKTTDRQRRKKLIENWCVQLTVISMIRWQRHGKGQEEKETGILPRIPMQAIWQRRSTKQWARNGHWEQERQRERDGWSIFRMRQQMCFGESRGNCTSLLWLLTSWTLPSTEHGSPIPLLSLHDHLGRSDELAKRRLQETEREGWNSETVDREQAGVPHK